MTEHEIPDGPTPKHHYDAVAGTTPQPYAEHEPRTVVHRVVVDDKTDLSMMSEIGDGTFVAWSRCRKCNHQAPECKCATGPVEPDYIIRWRHDRFRKDLNSRPDPEYPLLDSVLEWARGRGYIVAEAGEVDTLFTKLFDAVVACEAPAGTQVDDVLDDFQEAYSRVTGKPLPQWCWECKEDGQKTPADHADENGPLCEGCYGRRVEDGLIATGDDEPMRLNDDGPDFDGDQPTEDDLDFARDTLGPDASQDEVVDLAHQRLNREVESFDAGF
ncbi:MAG: hypothetical protein HOV97_05760 [Nonomuraea sp.]|nr:hypothetical protein [Nonomuraea sp.]